MMNGAFAIGPSRLRTARMQALPFTRIEKPVGGRLLGHGDRDSLEIQGGVEGSKDDMHLPSVPAKERRLVIANLPNFRCFGRASRGHRAWKGDQQEALWDTFHELAY